MEKTVVVVDVDAVEVNDYVPWHIEAEERFSGNEEAVECVKQAQRGNTFAMEKIVRKNVPMLAMYAKRYSRCGSCYDDLFSEGMIAVMKAVNSFDVASAVTVGTALITAVRTAMRRYCGVDRNVHIAINASEIKSKLHAVAERMKAEGKAVTAETLATEMKMNAKKVQELLNVELGVISMNVKAEGKEGEGDEVGDFIAADMRNPYEEAERADSLSELKRAVEMLNDTEKTVIEFRYGLNGRETQTLAEVAEMIGKTAERVRQIEAQALRKMKNGITL